MYVWQTGSFTSSSVVTGGFGLGSERPRRMGRIATRAITTHTAKRARRTRSALRLDRHRAQELLVLRGQLGREGAAALGAGKEDAGVGAALEDLLHGVARGIGGRQRGLDGLHELLEQRVHVPFLRHGPLRYHTGPMAPWTPLGSAIRYTRGKLALPEDTWRLPDGPERDALPADDDEFFERTIVPWSQALRMALEGEITESFSKVAILQHALATR